MRLAGYDPWFLVKHPIKSLRGWWTGRLAALGFAAAIVASIVGTELTARSQQLVAIVVALGSATLGESIYGLMNWPSQAESNVRVASLQLRAFTRTVAAVAVGVFAGGALKGLYATDDVRILVTVAIAVSLLQVVTTERLTIANEKLENVKSDLLEHEAASQARWDAYVGVIAQAFLTALFVSVALSTLIVQALGALTVVFLVPALLLVVGLSIHAAEIDHLP
jgi:hypothetical protein